MMPLRRLGGWAACLAASWAVVGVIAPGARGVAAATAYPKEAITLVVPTSPGGGVDTQARLLAPYIRKYLPNPVPVTVRNQPGAGTKLGLLRVFDAKPDGYTIGLVPSSVPGLLHVTNDLGGRDPHALTYLARTGHSPYLFVRSVRGRFRSVEEMKGQAVRFGGPVGMRFQAALVARLMGLRLAYITYDSLPEAALAAMRGDLDAFFPVWDSGIKQVSASEGKLVPLFVTAAARLPLSPEIPTAAEFGLPLGAEDAAVLASANWLVAPPGLPDGVAAVLKDAVFRAVGDPEFEAQMQKANYTARPVLSPGQVAESAALTYAAYLRYRDLLTRP
jgi:tripartite-type tricarboxylate transporter receptor subunit TctC